MVSTCISVGPPPSKANSLAHATLAYHDAGSEPSIVQLGNPIALALSAQISTPDWFTVAVSKAI